MPVARMKNQLLFEEDVEHQFERETPERHAMLDTIDELNSKTDNQHRGKLVCEDNLRRSLVSLQASKERPLRRGGV